MPLAGVARLVAAALVALPLQAALAQRTDIVHGRVTAGADTGGIQNATISVLSRPDSVLRQTRTDAKGSYSVTFDKPGTAYLVSSRRSLRPCAAPASARERPRPPRGDGNDFSPG
jgi:hypothetical protein